MRPKCPAVGILLFAVVCVVAEAADRLESPVAGTLRVPSARPADDSKCYGHGTRSVPATLISCVVAQQLADGTIAGQESPTKPSAEVKKPQGLSFDLGGGVKMELVPIPAGSFMMGDEKGDAEEKPVHEVTISKPFYMGKYEVTQEQWEAVMGANPSRFKGAKNPVDRVSWEAAQAFVKKLNEKFAASGATFSLPTEAQWEYACRAGTSTRFDFGNDEAGLAEYGWFESNADGRTHPVGQKKPNAWGLYDMHGNLWEWCADWYDGSYYKNSPATDPPGPTTGESRVLRGGSWSEPGVYCRASYRYCLPPWFCVHCYGVRVVCSQR